MQGQDHEHLRLLSIFHYVVGGMAAFFGCFPLLHIGMGIMFMTSPGFFGENPGEAAPPAWFGLFFVLMGGFFFLAAQTLAVCTILSGRYLAQRTRYLFIFVVACVQCVFIPFGTILGIFTIIVLSRDSVRALFAPGVAARED